MLRRYFLNALALAYVRLYAARQIVMQKTANLFRAVAKAINVATAIRMSNDVLPTEHPAADAEVDRAVRVGHSDELMTAAARTASRGETMEIGRKITLIAPWWRELKRELMLVIERVIELKKGTARLAKRDEILLTGTQREVEAKEANAVDVEETGVAVQVGSEVEVKKAAAGSGSRGALMATGYTARCIVWEYPIFNDGVLLIRSVWQSEQDGEIVEIPMWINPALENGVLTIVQVYTATKTNDTVEVV